MNDPDDRVASPRQRRARRPIPPGLIAFALGLSAPAFAQFTFDREPPGPSSRATGLAITEIMYNPAPVPGLSTNVTLEFVEFYNSGAWDEHLGGYSLEGDVTYRFPSETVLGPGAYLVVARVPELIGSTYGIGNLIGPWDNAEDNRLSTERGLVQLRNRQGAVLLSVDYRDSPPWPEGADGTGHSLVLARPSYGENNFQAWAQSDSIGGSPGGPEPLSDDPLAAVLINEWQNHSDPVDWIELYNHGNTTVDLSGAYLSDAPATNFYRIPDGTTLPPRGFASFDQTQLGFELFAGGESIFFWSSNRARLLDVIDFRGQSNNVSSGRSPDGGPLLYGLSGTSRGFSNRAPMRYPVVINEIMYNPISGNDADEYVELHNRTDRAVSVAGWSFAVGIDYTFPTNTLTQSMPPGAYWVVASDPENLMRLYPNLTTNNTFGPFDGALANGGERLVFATADYDRVAAGGTTEEVKLDVPASDINYSDGGRWTFWSDGDGSSLELIDPEADGQLPSNWADSEDAGESRWTAIEMTVPAGEALGLEVNDSLMIIMLDVGECQIDEVEVRVDQGGNLVVNGGFEAGLDGWSLQGSHDFSTLGDDAFAGAHSLHIRAGSRGDNQSNRILSAPLAGPIPQDASRITIRAKVKWIRGFPEILFRLHGSATEAYGRMALPRRLGTPGSPNSRFAGNAGPAVYDVRHAPLLPAPGEPVTVTARASDPQGAPVMRVRYRVDPSEAYEELSMRDDGAEGDGVANDGHYAARIPGQTSGAMVAFYVEARDGLGAAGTFPDGVFPALGMARCWPYDAVRRECVVRWDELTEAGDFATYHLWVTSLNSNRWHTRHAMDNTELDATFVYNGTRVIYNALPLYSGSPWHRTNSVTGPAGLHRVDYEVNFPDDDPLLGATDFVLNNPGNPDVLTISDLSAVAEQTVYEIFEGMDMPHNHRRYIHFFVNGDRRSRAYERSGKFIFEDSQQPNGDMLAQWFPDDSDGQLFKVEDWFEMHRNGFDVLANNDADLQRRTVTLNDESVFVPAPYRFMFRKRSLGTGNSASDYEAIYALVDAASPADDPDRAEFDPEVLGAVVDWEAWMRFFAVQRAVGNWDSFGWERGKNDYLYKPANGGYQHMPWDIDYSLGLGKPAQEPLFASNDPRIIAMFNTSAIARAYWRAFADLVDGPFQNEVLDPRIDARVQALLTNAIDIDLNAVDRIKAYIGERRAFIQSRLADVAAPFQVDGPSMFTTADNLVVLTGTAPVAVRDLRINGERYPVTWTSVSNFTVRIVLTAATNTMTLEGLDRSGEPVAGPQSLEVVYTGPLPDPAGALVFSEIMYAPSLGGGQYLEIQNRSALNFALAGWRMEGVNLTFPAGAIVTNGQTLVLVQDRAAFVRMHGSVPVFAQFGGSLDPAGEVLALIEPRPEGDRAVDAVRFEARAPWPAAATGGSIQLVDAGRDNSRPSNWAFDPAIPATPGAPNSTESDLPAYDPVWLNEVQTENLGLVQDAAGDADPWIELFNAGDAPVSLDGYYLAQRYAGDLLQWPLPPGFIVAPGQHRLVWADGEPAESSASAPHTDFRLDYDGQLALVRQIDGQAQITDYLTWTAPGANASYGDVPDGQPAYRFRQFHATPGATNQAPSFPVVINEYLARNSSGQDWFELFNGGDQPIDLGDFYLTDDAGDAAKFSIPDNGNYVIAPSGFLLVWADDAPSSNGPSQAALHVNFRLGGDGGIIQLVAPDGVTVLDQTPYGAQTQDVSEGRYADGATVIYSMPKPTPGGRNTVPGANSPPAFPPIPPVVLIPGGRSTFSVRASDPEIPEQTLLYSFEPQIEGAAINASGLFRWIVPTNQTLGDYRFVIRATDTGVPPRSATTEILVSIVSSTGVSVSANPPPVIQTFTASTGEAVLTFSAVPGLTYRVLYKDDLADPEWHLLELPFAAAQITASITDTVLGPRRYYVVQQID